MPTIERLNPPLSGMDRFINVSQKVGDGRDCSNNSGDVEVVQRLIALGGAEFANKHGFGLPQPTGRFDPITAYYIFHMQAYQHNFRNSAVIDGCVSPALGMDYGGGIYVIVGLNFVARRQNQWGWEQLMNRFSLAT